MRNFKQLKIWQKGFQIAVNCYKLTNTLPEKEKYSLSSQINRAGVSISSNIAEGSSRNSEKDYNRFMEYSLGSTFELETQLLIAKEMLYGDAELINQLLSDIDEQQKMLTSFMKQLKK